MPITDADSAPTLMGASTLVADAMHPGVLSCSPVTPVRDVARIMSAHGVHSVVVITAGEAGPLMWGVISDLDLIRSTVEDPVGQTAGQIAITEAARVSSQDSIYDAAQLMLERLVSHLIVVDSTDGRPVGVISTLDLASAIAHASA